DGRDDRGVAGHAAQGGGGEALPVGGAADAEPVGEGLVGDADDDVVTVAAFAVAAFGVGGGVTGELDEGSGAAAGDRFGEDVAVGVGFAGEGGDGIGDDEAGFGVEPAVQAPHSAERFGQRQVLRGPFLRSVFV